MDEDDPFAAELSMRILKGWKRISNKGGFVNEVTGQTLVVAKQEFGEPSGRKLELRVQVMKSKLGLGEGKAGSAEFF